MSVAPISVPADVPAAPATDAAGQFREVRTGLKELTPPGQWNAVVAEVSRVQAATSSSVLDAYRAVAARLATGWVPPPVAYPPPGR